MWSDVLAMKPRQSVSLCFLGTVAYLSAFVSWVWYNIRQPLFLGYGSLTRQPLFLGYGSLSVSLCFLGTVPYPSDFVS